MLEPRSKFLGRVQSMAFGMIVGLASLTCDPSVTYAAGPVVDLVGSVRSSSISAWATPVPLSSGQLAIVSLNQTTTGSLVIQAFGENNGDVLGSTTVVLSDRNRRAEVVAAYASSDNAIYAVLSSALQGSQPELILCQVTPATGSRSVSLNTLVLSTGHRSVEVVGRSRIGRRDVIIIGNVDVTPAQDYQRNLKVFDEKTGVLVASSSSPLNGTIKIFAGIWRAPQVLSAGPEGVTVMDIATGRVTSLLGAAESHTLFNLKTAWGSEPAIYTDARNTVQIRLVSELLQNGPRSFRTLPSGAMLAGLPQQEEVIQMAYSFVVTSRVPQSL
jgi:hypothetical protein